MPTFPTHGPNDTDVTSFGYVNSFIAADPEHDTFIGVGQLDGNYIALVSVVALSEGVAGIKWQVLDPSGMERADQSTGEMPLDGFILWDFPAYDFTPSGDSLPYEDDIISIRIVNWTDHFALVYEREHWNMTVKVATRNGSTLSWTTREYANSHLMPLDKIRQVNSPIPSAPSHGYSFAGTVVGRPNGGLVQVRRAGRYTIEMDWYDTDGSMTTTTPWTVPDVGEDFTYQWDTGSGPFATGGFTDWAADKRFEQLMVAQDLADPGYAYTYLSGLLLKISLTTGAVVGYLVEPTEGVFQPYVDYPTDDPARTDWLFIPGMSVAAGKVQLYDANGVLYLSDIEVPANGAPAAQSVPAPGTWTLYNYEDMPSMAGWTGVGDTELYGFRYQASQSPWSPVAGVVVMAQVGRGAPT